ncbi:MAG: transcription-repair coupling factor [Armatimonadetes bacterium RBG_16_58_9]|nr:MAG: transcription-repair coupling factor [Armatimonadetes bacterium RBG_16_58_9]
MSIERLLERHIDSPKAREVLEWIDGGTRLVQIEGLAAAAKGWMLASMFTHVKRATLVVTYTYEQAERIAEDLPLYGIPEEQVMFYPPSDSMIYEEGPPDFSVIGERLAALRVLSLGKPVLVVAPINSALRRTMPRHELMQSCMSLRVGDELDLDEFISKLVRMGYDRTDVVDRHGEFSRRGGIVDVYASNEDDPLRIELFGDRIESIRTFQSASQRSTGKVGSALILPSREVLLDPERTGKAITKIRKELQDQIESLENGEDKDAPKRLADKVEDDITSLENLAYFDDIEYYLPYLESEHVSVFDYLPGDALVVLDEPMQIKSHWEQHEEKMVETIINRATRGLALASRKRQHVPFESTIKHALADRQGVTFTLLPRPVSWAKSDMNVHIESSPMDSFAGRIEAATDQIKTWLGNDQTVVIATPQDKRMLEILEEFGLAGAHLEEGETVEGVSAFPMPKPEDAGEVSALEVPKHRVRKGLYVAHAPLRSGFKLLDASLMVLTDSDIFGAQRLHRPRRASHEGIPISSVLDLKEGDYVVHVSHGIGYYRGIHTLATQGVAREYLLLEYAGNDKLYVPSDQIDRVQKYIGGETAPPAVHRLGGSEWMRTTKRVQKSVREMAKELVELYAWRHALGGHPYGPDTPWQQEMESAFPYRETPDQMEAIVDVKRDLEESRAMDRLICGDVGYGKTEVAIRAAFKVVSEGRQAAILCPTTVLAQQHLNTFAERLAAFPITVEMLSRFRTRKEQLAVIENIKFGTADIVIGTHRLLSKDVEFKDLGLVVVDEEQRFGVRHKEKLKQLKKTVDVLTMTATPIPRTLHMSLSGIRDMSVINDPPEGRMPIKTLIKQADSDTVRNAIVHELDRGGQVFFVHNRVENIGHVADQVQKLVPYARLDVAHGQMRESDLERVMMDFYEHKFDVLVCTTIIESGLDIPNVNTIVINDADKMGLAQLYQLRGRVGRSDRQAYAYLLYKPDKMLTEVAEKRLDAIREFTELGSGYRIAMRDLEIRGAGNLLGREQSGQMAAVGFDLYCQLLSKAVSEMKGEEVQEIELPPVDLPIDAFIPQDYMPTEAHRILFYKKMAAIKSVEDVQAVQDEMEDRFGDPPRSVWNILAIIRLRLRCHELGIASIGIFRRQIHVKFGPGVRLSQEMCREWMNTYRRHWFEPDKLVINPSSPRIISEVEDMVEVLAKAFRKMKLRLAGV